MIALSEPFWLWFLLPIALFLLWTWRRSLVERPASLRIAADAARMLALALIVLSLCRPTWTRPSQYLHLVQIVDVSASVDLDGVLDALEQVAERQDSLRSGDSHSLFLMGDGLMSVNLEEARERIETWRGIAADERFRSATRIGDALLGARLAYPAGKAKRLLLYSDAVDTGGDLDAALDTLDQEGVEVFLEDLPALAAAEAAVLSITPSTSLAYQGEVLRLQVRLASNRDMSGRLRILHDGVLQQEQQLRLRADAISIAHADVTIPVAGRSLWTAELIPEEDFYTINNQAHCSIEVRGRLRVLICHAEPQLMRPLQRALAEQDIEVELRGAHGLPESMEGLLAFDGIILAQVNARHVSQRQQALLKRYVEDFGGGLAMLGSEDSFGLGGWFRSPVEDVLPLTSRYEQERERPSMAMVLLIDTSGSMSGLPMALARQASAAAIDLLGDQDLAGLVTFDSDARVVSELRSAIDRDALRSAIDGLEAGGGTNLYPGLEATRMLLETASAQIKHVVLLSDGMSVPGDHEGAAQRMADQGITISAVALGQGAHTELMARMAEIGRGRYYETMDPNNVPQIFSHETMEASRSSIKEDLILPLAVGEHPLLEGIDVQALPALFGYVMTRPKPTAQVLLAAENGDPLLALMRVGLGTGLAFASDASDRWAGEWVAWESFGRFWSQVLRAMVRQRGDPGVQISHDFNEERLITTLIHRDQAGRPLVGSRWQAAVVADNAMARSLEVEEIGLGRYRIHSPTLGAQHLALRLRQPDAEQLHISHHHRPYPREYLLHSQAHPALKALPKLPTNALHQGLQAALRHYDLSPLLILLAIAASILGIALRRI